jgi:hypothetical protein
MPFVVALALAAFLARTRWLAIAQAAGFAVSVTLAVGWSFESLTSTRKLALVAVASLLLCLLVERLRTKVADIVCVALLALSNTWVLWRLLAQKDLVAAVVAGVLAAAYVAWISGSTLKVSDDPVRGAAGGAALGFGTGVLAILGASAVLGVVALAVGSAAAATLLVQALRNTSAPAGRSISLPAASAAALVGTAAVMTAELPWYALLPMLAVPHATLLSRPTGVFARAALAFVFALVPAAVAAVLAWFHPAA